MAVYAEKFKYFVDRKKNCLLADFKYLAKNCSIVNNLFPFKKKKEKNLTKKEKKRKKEKKIRNKILKGKNKKKI